MLDQQTSIDHLSLEQILDKVKTEFPNCQYDYKKHLISIDNEEYNTIGYIRLPLDISINSELNVQNNHSSALYLSIAADNAAICYTEGRDLIYHTTFSSYMTRRKQGFSQIKHLNKKGKSRAGSRVRLASTIEFFENINTILTELFDEYHIDRIALNCTPTLIPYLHESKVNCPFEKSDERLYKIPLHIQKSNFGNLEKTIKRLSYPTLFFNEEYKDRLMTFM